MYHRLAHDTDTSHDDYSIQEHSESVYLYQGDRTWSRSGARIRSADMDYGYFQNLTEMSLSKRTSVIQFSRRSAPFFSRNMSQTVGKCPISHCLRIVHHKDFWMRIWIHMIDCRNLTNSALSTDTSVVKFRYALLGSFFTRSC